MAVPVRKERFTEDSAFALITQFRKVHPEITKPHPGGTDEQLRIFMGAEDISTARHWRRRYDRKAEEQADGEDAQPALLVG